MSNLGLKPYTKQLTYKNGVTGYVNLNKHDANLILNIPVFKTTKLCPISLNLFYNYLDRNEISMFGKGLRLNYNNKLYKQSLALLRIHRSDGAVDGYEVTSDSDKYLNDETMNTITKVVSSEVSSGYYYSLKDKRNNEFRYDPTNLEYPYKIINSNNEEYTVTSSISTLTIKNQFNDEVYITRGEYQIVFEYQQKYTYGTYKVFKTVVILNTDETISQIKYYIYNDEEEEYVEISYLNFNINETSISITNSINNLTLKYNIANGLVSSIDEYFNSNDKKTTLIEYNSFYKTKVTDYAGKEKIYYFDGNFFPAYEFTENNISGSRYNSTTKLIESSFGPINFLNDSRNALCNYQLNSFVNNGITLESKQSTDADLVELLNGSLFKATGTGSLKYTINKKYIESDVISLGFVFKMLTTNTNSRKVTITLKTGVHELVTYDLDQKSVTNNYHFITLSNSVKNNVSNLSIEFTFIGNASVEIGNILLYEKPLGAFYKYDENKNLVESEFGNTKLNYSYTSNNKVKSSSYEDSSSDENTYNNDNLIEKKKEQYGLEIEYEYDSYNNISSKVVKSPRKDYVLKSKQQYIAGNLHSISTYNFSQHELIRTNYDVFGRPETMRDVVEDTLTYYLYDNELMNKIQYRDENNNYINIHYQYDSMKRLSKVLLPNIGSYEFNYDSRSNLINVKFNNIIIESYEYTTDSNQLAKVLYSNGNGIRNVYNANHMKVYQYDIENFETETLKFTYEYNNKNQLYKVKDANNVVLVTIYYDSNGQVNKISKASADIEFKYDNLDQVIREKRTFDNKLIVQSYDSIHRSKGSNPENMDKYFKQQGELLIATFIDDVIPKRYQSFDEEGNYTSELITNYKTSSGSSISFSKTYDDIVPCLQLSSAKRLNYKFNNISPATPIVTGSIGYWFKKSSSVATKNYLFSSKSTSRSSYIGVYIQNNYLYLEATDDDGTNRILCSSTYPIKENEWNFFALSFENRYDGEAQGSNNLCQYSLMLNTHIVKYDKSNPRLYVELDSYATYHIGCKYNGSTFSNFFTGKIAALFMGANKYTNAKSIMEFYRITKDYLVDNLFIDNDVETVDFGVGRLLNFTKEDIQNYEIIPLHNSIDILNGRKPSYFNMRMLSEFDKDRTFNFNKKIKDYAFVADGNELKYEFDFDTMGTILTKVLFDVYNDKQYIFEIKDSTGNIVGLYRNSEQSLVVTLNGEEKISDFAINDNDEWNIVGLSFKKGIASDSTGNVGYYFRIYLNGRTCEEFIPIDVSINGGSLSIGAKHSKESVSSVLSTYSTNYPLYGLVEYVIVKEDSYLTVNTLDDLSNKMSTVKKSNLYDEFGLLRKTDVMNDKTSILSNTYNYKITNNNQYLTTDVSSEIIKTAGTLLTERNYTTNHNGNILTIQDDVFGNHEYTYNGRGFLTRDNNTYYTYDSIGNLLTKGSTSFEYENGKLVKVDNDNVTYFDNSLFIKSFGNKEYEYYGNKLKSVLDTSSGVEYLYDYDYRGLRIRKKKVVNGIITSTVEYAYNGDNLITEIGNNYRLDFLYDSNNLLFGFIHNNNNKYYYVRDVTGLILGITSETGELIETYTYDAFGKIINTAGSSMEHIGELNPFKYKGYYYDQETQFYYCTTRYYVANWGRWLTPDEKKYLEPSSINGLNLFSYCNNDPVQGYDPEGTWNWKKFTITALISVAAAAVVIAGTILTCGSGAAIAVPLLAGLSKASIAVTCIAAATTAVVVSAAAGLEATATIDLSITLPFMSKKTNVSNKFGVSFILDFKHNRFEVYGHAGFSTNTTLSTSYSVGMLVNYEDVNDYSGPFFDMGVQLPGGGLDFCCDPTKSLDEGCRAYSFVFNNPSNLNNKAGIYAGYDEYKLLFSSDN